MRKLLIVLVSLLWTVAFYESWEALTFAAEAAKIPDPRPWPASVDGFILAMGLMVVEMKRTARGKAVWWPRFGMMAATALSTGIQVGYAPDDVGRGGAALAAWSPLAVYFAWECLVSLIFRSTSEDAGESTATDAAETRPDGRTDGRTQDTAEDAPEDALVAASSTAGSAASEPHDGRTDGRTQDALERGQDAAVSAAPVRPPTTVEVRKIEGRLGRTDGRKSARAVAASTGVPEKVVRAYLATRTAPSPPVVVSNGAGVPAE